MVLARSAALVVISVLVSTISWVTHAAAAGGVSVLLDFEAQPVGSSVNRFPGLTLDTFNSNNFDGSPHFTIVQPPTGTVSGTHALQSHFDTGGEFTGTHMTMAFDIPQSLVTASVGLATKGPPEGSALLLQGFNVDPNSQAPSQPVSQTVSQCLGSVPTSVTTPLQLNDPSSSIRFAVLSLVSCATPTNADSGSTNDRLLIDNLSYERPLNVPLHESDPPLVAITNPQYGQSVTGAAPGEIAYTLQASIQESDLDTVTATVNGGPAIPLSYRPNGNSSYVLSFYMSQAQGLVVGQNTVALTARDFDQPPNSGFASVTFNYTLKPPVPLSMVDYWPTAFEVTQAIDTGPIYLDNHYSVSRGYDVPYSSLANVPLMAGKQTLIRVYGAATGTTSAVPNVPATMTVRVEGCNGSNCMLANNEPPIKGWLSKGVPDPNLSGITVFPIGSPQSNVPGASRVLQETWDFLLPAAWTQSNVAVSITINKGDYVSLPGLVQQPSQPECSRGVEGECLNNNEITIHLPFQAPPPLVVNPVFIHVTGTYGGQSYNDVHPSDSQFDDVLAGLNELYPMHVIAGTRQDITVSPGISNEDLVDKIDDASGFQTCLAWPELVGLNVWLGLFPNLPAGPTQFNANSGGVQGTANYGGAGTSVCELPSAWADVTPPGTGPVNPAIGAAHEIGHLIGFDHWGCEDGGDEECHSFPIPHGGIGGTGIDINAFRVIPLDIGSPPHAHDFMVTSVDPGFKWVSWYTYQIMMTHFSFTSLDAEDPHVLIVRGTISPDGHTMFSPAYRVDIARQIQNSVVEDDASQIYSIRGYDQRGNTILIHNFEPEKRENHISPKVQGFSFSEALPDLPHLSRLAVFKGTRQIGQLRPSVPVGPVEFSITAPTRGARWRTGTAQTIRWTTPDKRLSALVELSIDGGRVRRILARDVTGTSLKVNSNEVPGGSSAIVIVELSDGIHTTEAVSPQFSIAPKPPSVHIMQPLPNARAFEGIALIALVRGFDRQEKLSGGQFKWTLDRTRSLGSGLNMTFANLPAGDHLITVRVTDSRGLSAEDSVLVHIEGLPSKATCDCGVFVIILGVLILILLVGIVIITRKLWITSH